MGRSDIRKRLKKEYEELGGYEQLGAAWGLSDGMVWRIMNEDGYWPTDKKIREKLILEARKRGIVIHRPGRKKDLFSMDPLELRWALENRVEV